MSYRYPNDSSYMLGSSVDTSSNQDNMEPTTGLTQTVDDVSLASPSFISSLLRKRKYSKAYGQSRKKKAPVNRYTSSLRFTHALKSLELLVLGMNVVHLCSKALNLLIVHQQQPLQSWVRTSLLLQSHLMKWLR